MQSPNPNWQPGDKIETPESEMVSLDFAQLPQRDRYRLLISAIVPRPIALVSTVDAQGNENLAPFSFYSGVSSNPPCLVLAIGQKEAGVPKDTLSNILETEEFVVNSANEWLVEPLVYTAGAFPAEVSEREKSGLSTVPSVSVKPPRIKEAAIHFECRLYDKLQVGDGALGSTTLVVGEILTLHAAKNIYRENKIDFSGLKPASRLGGISYGRVTETYDIPVPRINPKD